MIRREWWRWEYVIHRDVLALEMNEGTLERWVEENTAHGLSAQGGTGTPTVEILRIRPWQGGETDYLRLVAQGQSDRRI